MENVLVPCGVNYFSKKNDNEIYNFWLYFNQDEENGVRVVGTYGDAIDRAKLILSTNFDIKLVTIYNDKLDNYLGEVFRYEY